MPSEFQLNPQWIQNSNSNSLAGFGYQDPNYSAVDGMTPIAQTMYHTSMGNVTASDPLNAIQQSVANNNAWSAEQAQKQMDFQTAANEKAMNFSAEQAALNRDWQKMMSDTAHQREIIDLQKAGLNPVLSATGGNGASVGSGAAAAGVTSAGAQANGDQSGTMAMMSYLAKMLEAQTSILNTQTSANAAMMNSRLMYDANLYGTDMSKYLGELDYDKSLNDAERYAVYTGRRALNDVGFMGHFETPASPKVAAIQAAGMPPDDPKAAEEYWKAMLGDDYKPVSSKSSTKNSNGVNAVEAAIKAVTNPLKSWYERIKNRNMNED